MQQKHEILVSQSSWDVHEGSGFGCTENMFILCQDEDLFFFKPPESFPLAEWPTPSMLR